MANTKWHSIACNALDFGRTKEETKARWHYLFKMGQKIDHMPVEKVSEKGFFKKHKKPIVSSDEDDI